MRPDPANFKLIILPGKNPPSDYLAYYNLAYRCWRECWQEAYRKEMNHDSFLVSDSFTRQDEIITLFYKEECVGLVFFKHFDFSEEGTKHDSYFDQWPEFTLTALCRNGKRILVLSQFSINLNCRKLLDGINPRDLLIGLCYERFLRSDCDAGASAVRIQKNMEKASEKVGATTLFKNMAYSFNQRVDLLAFYPDKIHPSTVPGIAELSSQLYSTSVSLVKPILSLEKKEVNVLTNLKKRIAEMGEMADLYPWHDPYAYGLYLAQTYYYVCHSTQLLALSAGMMKTPDAPFHRRFLEHAAEEKGHETMLLNDLKNLGFVLSDFPELPEARMFWEPQFYKVQHIDPLSLMGYIVALEAVASDQCPKIKTKLEESYKKGTYSFIQVHGEDDPEHVEKACLIIASLPPERRKWVEENFDQTVTSFQHLVTRMMVMVKERKSVKAA